MAALTELDRLKTIALNKKENDLATKTLIYSLNIRSLSKNLSHLLKAFPKGSKVIALQETWCHMDQTAALFAIPGYNLHLVSRGRGKGIATYFKPEFEVSGTKSSQTHQMCKVSNVNFDAINVYRSQDANSVDFLNDLKDLIGDDESRPCIIVGDLNWNYCHRQGNRAIGQIESLKFRQHTQKVDSWITSM